jgi:hypothetical protein
MKYAITFDQFLDCIQKVETGGKPRKGEFVVGDGGKAIGPLQIHECCWDDAIIFAEKNGDKDNYIGINYEDCNYWQVSTIIAMLYFRRHAKAAMLSGDWERLARIWNGGPTGWKKKATLPYWEKVEAEIKKVVNDGK